MTTGQTFIVWCVVIAVVGHILSYIGKHTGPIDDTTVREIGDILIVGAYIVAAGVILIRGTTVLLPIIWRML